MPTSPLPTVRSWRSTWASARSSSRAARCATMRSSRPSTQPARRWSPPAYATSATERGGRAAPPPAAADPRHLLHEPADRGAGQHDRQRRAALDRAPPARGPVGAAVDRGRIHARARQPADAVRLDGRPAWAQARVHDRPGAVHARLAAVQPRAPPRLLYRLLYA